MFSDFDPIYLIWLFVAVSAGLTVEAVYLMTFSAASYRSQVYAGCACYGAEAIQSTSVALDCFASLAMTVGITQLRSSTSRP